MHLIYCRTPITSKRRTDCVALHKTSKPISNFFVRRNEKDEAMKVMFPDSEIAQKFQCGRSMATALLKELSHAARQDLLTNMRIMPFTVYTDGSNDVGSGNKQFPIVLRTVDVFTSAICNSCL